MQSVAQLEYADFLPLTKYITEPVYKVLLEKRIMMSFYNWIVKNYRGSDCPIGDLVADAMESKGFPRESRKHKEILNYLIFQGACLGCIDAFEDAFRRYRKSGVNRPCEKKI